MYKNSVNLDGDLQILYNVLTLHKFSYQYRNNDNNVILPIVEEDFV